LERVREWARELQARTDEVLATLRDEGVVIESVFLDHDEQGDFLLYFMKARSLKAAAQTMRRSSDPVDQYHSQFKLDAWESRTPLELLIDFENFG